MELAEVARIKGGLGALDGSVGKLGPQCTPKARYENKDPERDIAPKCPETHA